MVEDYTDNGRCSKCGSCCTNYLPITEREFRRLVRWAKKHRYQPKAVEVNKPTDQVIDVTCPFFDKEQKCCVCYDERPEVCRVFSCHEYDLSKPFILNTRHQYRVHNLRKEIFGEDLLSYESWLVLAQRIVQAKNGEKSDV